MQDKPTIAQRTKIEGVPLYGPNYYWVHWPAAQNDLEQSAMDFVRSKHPRTISIGIQGAADLIVQFIKEKGSDYGENPPGPNSD